MSFLNHHPKCRLPQILLPGAPSTDMGLTQRFIPQAAHLLFIALSLAGEARPPAWSVTIAFNSFLEGSAA